MRSSHRFIAIPAYLCVLICAAATGAGCSSGGGNSLVNGSGGQGGEGGAGGLVGGTSGSGGKASGEDADTGAGLPTDAAPDGTGSADASAFAPLIWSKTMIPDTLLDAIGGTGENDVWVTGRNGQVFISAGDDKWTQRLTDVNFDLYKMWGPSPDNVWVAVNANIVLHWTGKWQHEFQGIVAGERFTDATGSSATDIFMVSGRLLHSVGDGVWSPIKLQNSGSIANVWSIGPNEALAADDSRAFYIKDGAVTPLGLSGLPAGAVRGLWGNSPNNVYVIKGDGIAHLSTSGKWIIEHTWDTVKEQDGAVAIWGANSSEIFVATGFGQLLRSHGDGQWSISEIDQRTAFVSQIVGTWGTSAANVYVAAGSIVYHGRPGGK